MFTVGPCPFRGYISNHDKIRSRQLRVVIEAEVCKQDRIGTRSTEEYKKSACEDTLIVSVL
jgi:hypothetical protein